MRGFGGPVLRGPHVQRLALLVALVAALLILPRLSHRQIVGSHEAVYPVVAAANVLLRARRLHRLRITYRRPDGRLRTVERESHGLFVANQRALGGGIGLPTRSDNSDGVFELALLSAESRASLLATLAAMRLGRPVSRWTLGVWRAVEARIECERPLAFFGDGDEIGLARSFTVRVLPRALRVLR